MAVLSVTPCKRGGTRSSRSLKEMGAAISVRCCVENASTEDPEESDGKEAAVVRLCPAAPWHESPAALPEAPRKNLPRTVSNATTLPT